MKINKYSFFVVIILITITGIFSQESFEDFKKGQKNDYQTFKKNEIKAFKSYHDEQNSKFIKYKEEIEKKWGEFKTSTPQEWVSYSPDFNGKAEVDFKSGKVKVEAVSEVESDKMDENKQKQKVQELVLKQLKTILKQKDSVNDEPILKNQVRASGQTEDISEDNIEKKASSIIKEGKFEKSKNKEGKTRFKFKINLTMAPDHLQKRVKRYKPAIENLCRKNSIDPALALAVIHTESYFNPKAYNRHGNAYGMMQIVPKYAGRTMNYVLYKSNSKPTSKQLYNPKINLAMGIGYLRWLINNKWNKVQNKQNLYFAIICSYNGGPGSVYKAMTGKMKNIGNKRWKKMFDDLNKMDTNSLYNKLRRDIPWAETRKYIKLVKEKMDKYYREI